MKPPIGCANPPSTLSRRSLRALACAEFDRMLTGQRVAEAVAHPLEFVCIPIVRTRRSGVCGHIWCDSRGSPTIHAHSWHLYSEVVAGAVTNEVFRVAGRPDGEYRVVNIHSEDMIDRITPTGRNVRVDGGTAEVWRGGESYTLGANTFHRSTPVPGGSVMTLVRATMLAGHHDRVLVRPPSLPRTVRRQRLTGDRALDLVAKFRETISTGVSVHAVQAGKPRSRSRVPGPPSCAD